MTRRPLLWPALGFLAAAALAGCAHDAPLFGPGGFDDAKTDTANAERRAEFDRLDTDGNGVIDPTEAASDSADEALPFNRLDTNQDRKISRQEFMDAELD
ncbi:hypothetical protein [Larsenimonas suaedae]|uniref:EF-hand domain-containing protein n=1 Tax=Larsenimonas suaedae TaxID=1851019 RepID=A0ABU1GYD7_9GAMM|nr:hypothetical protein [Larsenimonas suaedae]MCM2973130.1 hypothetical protein [Larsenimonas suaedae]MDR5896567.1 hypothetical protein [Larsenimonas suaedae]